MAKPKTIMCRKCRTTVPIETKKCPNCGADIIGPAAKIIVGAIAIIIIWGLFSIFNNSKDPAPVNITADNKTSEVASPEAEQEQEKTVDNSIAYEVVTSEDYGIGLKNHSFRVTVDEKATDEQLLWVFEKLDDSKYEEVTVWFFKKKATIEAGDPYDIAMIRRTGQENPKVTR